MFGRSITTIAACALGASALILPPGVAPSTNNHDASFPTIVNPKHQTITFPCPSCAFSPSQEKADDAVDHEFWIQGGPNSIAVNFTISEDGRNLEMGGSSIYPDADAPPRVHQVSNSISIAEFESGNAHVETLEVTSFAATFHPSKVNSGTTEGADSITVMRVSEMSLEGQTLPMPELVVTMLEMADGQILILDAESREGHHFKAPHHGLHMGPPEGRPDRRPFNRPGVFGPHGKPPMHKECGMLPAPLCQLKRAIEAKIHGMRQGGRPPCHGRKGKHTNPWMDKDGHVKLPTHIKGPKFHVGSQPDEAGLDMSFERHPHKDGHHRHHHGHGFLHAFVRGFIAVLIPVMAGVTVGMAVSFVGLAFGRLITFLWVKFVRGGKRGYASVALTEDTAESGDMKIADFVETDAPPMYEDAPKYEDAEQVDVKEEK